MKSRGPLSFAYESPCNPRREAPPALSALRVLDEFCAWLVSCFGINLAFASKSRTLVVSLGLKGLDITKLIVAVENRTRNRLLGERTVVLREG